MCYYFDNIITERDIGFDNILLDTKLYKKEYENNLIDDISYNSSTGAKPLPITFDKLDRLIKIHRKIRYLVLFDYGWFGKICDTIKYFISKKKWY